MDLMELLKGQLGSGLMDQLSNQIGGDKQQTETATNGILSTLIGALSQNVTKPGGAEALAGALDRDHDGSILNDISGFLGGNTQTQNPSTTNGAGILSHILGDKLGGAAQMISQISGLNGDQTGSLMTTLAPIVLGVLGQAKQQNGLDANGIAGLLGNTTQTQSGSNPFMGMVSQFLDQNHDGNVMDDIVNMGMKFFSK